MSGPFGSTAWMANPASGFYDFEISNSLRFNDDDSAYLNFTPSTAGNRRTFTVSCWIKHSGVDNGASALPIVWGSTGTVSALAIAMSSNRVHSILFYNGGQNNQTTALFRDSSAWYHFVLACDTTQSTATNRTKLYVNGVAVTAWESANYPNQNTDGGINAAGASYIGRQIGQSRYFDGYMAEVNQIDGLALGPDSFGEFKNDIWIPKDTAGLTFGDQGYRLQFKQTGTGTASSTTIGADTSGNDNHWTSNNLVASDVMPDSPTNNFATINPLSNPSTVTSGNTFSEGNLKLAFSTAAGTFPSVLGTFPMVTGKWYWEISYDYASQINAGFGVYNQTTSLTTDYGAAQGGLDDAGLALFKTSTILTLFLDTKNTVHSSSFADPIIIGVMFDADNGKLYLKFANAELTGQTISNGTTIFDTFTTGKLYMPAIYHGDGGSGTKTGTIYANFGQDSSFSGSQTAQGNADENGIGDFYYAPPSGFKTLCTSNLPDPVEAIDPAQGGSPQDYFNTVLWTGNDADDRSISGVGFQPDWVWLKARNHTYNHYVLDSVRGDDAILFPNLTNAEDTTDDTGFDSFDSDGFTISQVNGWEINDNAKTYVAWNWKAGTAFSNDASATGVGSIDSAGSVNTDVGFSIISYTGVSADATVAHGLGVAPDFIIAKIRSNGGGEGWPVFHRSMGVDEKYLDKTNGQTDGTVWNDTLPTSSVFSVNGNDWTNKNGSTMIAYCFAEVDGYSKFGTYTGNNNADGPFVYTGFRPAFVMISDTTVAGQWVIYDSKRDNINFAYKAIFANTSGAESTNTALGNIDFLSNGFKYRDNSNDVHAGQVDGATPIYMAFAEQPFKYSNAR